MESKDVLEAVTERIFQFVEQEGLTYADFAASLDIGSAVVSHMKNGRNKVSLNVYAKILSSFPKLNPDWLLFGEGTMYRDDSSNNNGQQAVTVQPNLFTSQTATLTEKTTASSASPELQQQTAKASRQLKKIVVFYDDNSFQELIP